MLQGQAELISPHIATRSGGVRRSWSP
jgi:hypothetical protein